MERLTPVENSVLPPRLRDLLIRPARASDRRALETLGQPPAAVAALCPARVTRLAWFLSGLQARSLIAFEVGTELPLGSVQFVRARRDTGTWMFGLWRVAAAHRRLGIGRRLVEEGARRMPALRRLYSFVEWGNDASIAAHRRLGFEMSEELQGTVTLGALSTIGPTAPAARLRPAGSPERHRLAEIYERALGPLWRRLFPGRPRSFSLEGGLGTEGPILALLRALRDGPVRLFTVQADAAGSDHGFVALARIGGTITLYTDPERCDAGLLAKVAVQLLALGASRERDIELRGLPRHLLAAPGPIRGRILMGLPETERLR